MGLELAKAYVQIIPTTKDIKDSITTELGGEVEKAGSDAGGKFSNGFSDVLKKAGKIAAGAFAAGSAAVGALVKSSVSGFAEYEQLVGGVETLFGESSKIVLDYADNAYKSAGLSANAYMETVTSFSASLLQGLDGDTETAANIANIAIVDMADNVNKMGTSMESVQNAFQGFAKGNYTMLDNLKLGYGGTQSEMVRLINDSGVLDETIDSMNGISLDTMILAIHEVQQQIGISGATAEEAESTISGSVASMSSAWSNLVTGLANDDADIGSLVGNVVTTATTAAGNLLPVIQQALSGLASALTTIVPALVSYIPTLMEELLPAFVTGVSVLLASLTTILPELLGVVSEQLPSIMQTFFTEILPTLISAIVSIFPQLVSAVVQAIPLIVDGITQMLQDGTVFSQILQAIIGIVMMLVDNIGTIIDSLVTSIPIITQALCDALIENFPALLEGVIALVLELVNHFDEVMEGVWSAIPIIVETLVQVLLENLPIIIAGVLQIIVSVAKQMPSMFVHILKQIPELFISIGNGIVNALPQLWSNVKNLFEQLFAKARTKVEEIKDVGKNLITGLWNGINDKVQWILDKIKGFGDSVMNKIKGIFGVHSPSREMAWVGEMLDRGLANGITDNIDLVEDAVDEAYNLQDAVLSANAMGNVEISANDKNTASILEKILAKLDDMGIYLDGDVLVGGLAEGMNNKLGKMAIASARGGY